MTAESHQKARTIVLSMLTEKSPSAETLSKLVAIGIGAVIAADPAAKVDPDLLRRELEESLNVFQGESVSLVSMAGHEPWLDARRAGISWSFWDRYLRYLREKDGLPPLVLDRLDVSTDRVLSRLEDPDRLGQWSRRGLVVGQVQSGKTSNYAGLICKAADSGYRFIIVLAGIHNSLRSQTQLRLDQGLLGFDTQRRKYTPNGADSDGFADVAIGVGRLPGEKDLFAISLTTSGEKDDFKKTTAKSVPFNFAGPLQGPVLLVVKKNATILKNLYEWLESVVATGSPKHIQDHSLLMIDDEADNASINTRRVLDDHGNVDESYDPTKVNAGIRRLLKLFDKSAYVGYTATPFANLYVEDIDHPEYGADLFPESFIEYLRAPSNYFGPSRLFGHGDTEALPLHRTITDYSNWMPDKHKSSHVPADADFPDSLQEAIHAFVLVRAARLARGQIRTHNSMLIHVTRFQNVQAAVASQVGRQLDTLRARIKFEDTEGSSVFDELRELWERDFATTTSLFPPAEYPQLSWDKVRTQLVEAVRNIEVKTINGTARDALEYYENRDQGLNVIAIGGDKLSRGLTLEGLSISYYLRASRTFDTLMQMGRWFGYRPGYEDVCRLYTSGNLWQCYYEVNNASEELVTEFETMADNLMTPRSYGLKVQNSVQGMIVTAANKMISATNLRIGFAGAISESVLLYCKEPYVRSNLAAAHALLGDLGPPTTFKNGNLGWSGVLGSKVVDDFFNRYSAPAGAWRVHPQMLGKFIGNCNRIGELTSWTVVLVNNTSTDTRMPVGGHMVGLTKRAILPNLESKVSTDGTYSIRRILSPTDELYDFTDDQVKALLSETLSAWSQDPGTRSKPTMPAGRLVRRSRPATDGLLLLYPLEPVTDAQIQVAGSNGIELTDQPILGFAVSFPDSDKAEKVDYTANKVYLRELFSITDDGDDDA